MELASVETNQVDAQAEAWFESYVEAASEPSGQRRRVRHRHNRVPKHLQLHRRETLMMVASFVFIGAMTACFYAVLTLR